MTLSDLVGWEVVGHDGELLLYASPDKETGVLIDERNGKAVSQEQPLQVFFKWGNFVEVADEG